MAGNTMKAARKPPPKRTPRKTPASTTRVAAPSPAPEASLSLGERIRRLRHDRRWSLAELSKRSSIATSTLSKVENGVLSLAYDRLVLIAAAFDLTLSEFLSPGPANRAPEIATARISWARTQSGEKIETNGYIYHYLCTDLRIKRMVPILSQVKARTLAEFGSLLRHEGEEFVFVTKGRVEVQTEFYEPRVLSQGEGVYLDSRMGHAYINVGSGEAWIISVNTNPVSAQSIASDRGRSGEGTPSGGSD